MDASSVPVSLCWNFQLLVNESYNKDAVTAVEPESITEIPPYLTAGVATFNFIIFVDISN